jgi:hypothetical protein
MLYNETRFMEKILKIVLNQQENKRTNKKNRNLKFSGIEGNKRFREHDKCYKFRQKKLKIKHFNKYKLLPANYNF